MLLQTLARDDKKRLLFLLNKARGVLHSLHVPFTPGFLRAEMIKTYFSVFNDEAIDADAMVADRDEPANLAIVLTSCLKTYGIVYEMHVGNAKPAAATFTIPGEGVIIFKRTSSAGEPGFRQHRARHARDFAFRMVVLLAGVGIIEYALYQGIILYDEVLWIPILLVQVAGIAICYQLFKMDRLNGYSNSFLDKFCMGGNGQSNCRKVISSAAAKIAGISMSDIGAVYFLCMLAITLTGLYTGQYLQYASVLYWLALLPLPYTVFSIYYQAAVAKKICVLCCMVQGLLWLQAGCCLLWFPSLSALVIQPAIAGASLIIAVLVTVMYTGYTEVFRLRLKSERLELSAHILKTDPGFFRFQVDRAQPQFPPATSPESIQLGNEYAHHSLTAILSTECKHCETTLAELRRLGEIMGDEISITIIMQQPESLSVPYTPYIYYKEKPLAAMYYDLSLLGCALQNTTSIEETYEEQ